MAFFSSILIDRSINEHATKRWCDTMSVQEISNQINITQPQGEHSRLSWENLLNRFLDRSGKWSDGNGTSGGPYVPKSVKEIKKSGEKCG